VQKSASRGAWSISVAVFAAGLCSTAVARADAEDGAPATTSVAPEAGVQEDVLTEVYVGTYVNRIRDLSLRDGSVVIDFWVWFRWRGTEVAPLESFEIVNGEILSRTEGELLDDAGMNYTSSRVVARIFHIFDVRSFPYDDHTVKIELEDQENEDHRIRYIPDVDNAGIDPSVAVAGWAPSSLPPSVASHLYHSNYGFTSLGTNAESAYSRYTHSLHLHRTSRFAIVRLVWVAWLGVVLALVALRVRVTDLDARFGLGTGSIFAATANTYLVNEILPETDTLTLVEQINLYAVACIFASLFVSIASLRLVYRGRVERAERLDYVALVVLATVFLALNAVTLIR
jgi:hypothetical protein